MQLVQLTPELETQFWGITKQDYCDYYFFIYDWLLQRERTQIFLAFEADTVVGLTVIYDGHIAQLRGKSDVVKFMLDTLKLKANDILAPIDCEHLLIEKYPDCKLKARVNLLNLNKGEERLNVKTAPERLNVDDAEQVALLMNECYPEMWSEVTADNILALMSGSETVWLGIKRENKLVSFGYAMLTPIVSHVTWIATSPQNENKGYATSIVSMLVKVCLSVADTVIIYVMDDNAAANRVYAKVGFKPYKSYFLLKI